MAGNTKMQEDKASSAKIIDNMKKYLHTHLNKLK